MRFLIFSGALVPVILIISIIACCVAYRRNQQVFSLSLSLYKYAYLYMYVCMYIYIYTNYIHIYAHKRIHKYVICSLSLYHSFSFSLSLSLFHSVILSRALSLFLSFFIISCCVRYRWNQQVSLFPSLPCLALSLSLSLSLSLIPCWGSYRRNQ